MVEFKIHVFMHHYSTNLNLVIKSIPLRLTIFKSRKVLEFLIFKSKLFISMAGDGKKEFIKKIMFTTKEGIILLLVHVSYALLTLGSVLKKYP